MRQAFVKAILEAAEKDKRIVLLTGDLGFSVLEEFQKRFPKRFFNVGVAEQNMIGVAAGLALSGKKVFVYSIIPFVTLRCLEQVRNDICYQNLNVKLVGVGEGFSYGVLGMTHFSLEDIGAMRNLINMTVICPGDPVETELAVKQSVNFPGPLYLRIGKSGEPIVHSKQPDFEIGKGIIVKEGRDIAIITTGNMLYNGKQAAEKLQESGVSVRLISMHTIKPIDKEIILRAAKETKAIFTIEEHNIIGGLGSAVAEILAESGSNVLFKRIAVPDNLIKDIGSQNYLREKVGLTAEAITKFILKICQSKNIL
jgi:transketolase